MIVRECDVSAKDIKDYDKEFDPWDPEYMTKPLDFVGELSKGEWIHDGSQWVLVW